MTTLTLSKHAIRTYVRTPAGFVASTPLPTFDKTSHVQCWAVPVPVKVRKHRHVQQTAHS
jgi:hypothetical protein